MQRTPPTGRIRKPAPLRAEPDRDDRNVAIGIVRSEAVQIAKAVVARCAVSPRVAGLSELPGEMLDAEAEQDSRDLRSSASRASDPPPDC
jgi:hypothetical protein